MEIKDVGRLTASGCVLPTKVMPANSGDLLDLRGRRGELQEAGARNPRGCFDTGNGHNAELFEWTTGTDVLFGM